MKSDGLGTTAFRGAEAGGQTWFHDRVTRRRAITVALSAFSMTACSLFADFGGLSKEEVVVYAEAGAPTDLDADPVPTRDGGGSTDAATDDAAKNGCAALDASFCVDFEGPSPLTRPTWSDSDLGKDSGTLEVATDFATSPPGSALVRVPGATTGSCSFHGMRKWVSGTFQRLRVSFDLRTDASTTPLAINATSTKPARRYQIVVGAGGGFWGQTQRIEGDTIAQLDYQDDPATETNAWIRVVVEWNDATKKITVAAAQQTLVFSLPADSALIDPFAAFGAWCIDRPVNMHLDDIAIWLD